MTEQTQVERLAEVIAGHDGWYAANSVNACFCETPLDGVYLEDIQASHHAHLAAVVLTHLEAQGWAQGREEWGMQYERRADPTMDNPSGIVTNTMVSAHGETHVRQCIANGLPMSRIGRARAVRRRVTDWEPVE